VSTNHVILHERLRPVFADVDEYLCLDPESIAARITARTRAVMFVGLGGNTGRLAQVAGVCRARGLRLILDAAHMAGTRWQGRHVGAAADVAVFSFQATKNLPTADAGMICFADAALDALVRQWTWLGIAKDTYTRTREPGAYQWQYEVDHVGFKAHGNSIMAAIALVGLPYLDRDNAYRRTLCALYDEVLDGAVQRVPVPDGCESARHLYQVVVEDRDQVMRGLNDCQIFPGVHYRDNTSYPMYASMRGTCPRAAFASDRLISLPLHLRLTREDVARVGAVLCGLLAARGPRA
jgi:dTDP-4-amino-4,6-dideoxygalactose transaminase